MKTSNWKSSAPLLVIMRLLLPWYIACTNRDYASENVVSTKHCIKKMNNDFFADNVIRPCGHWALWKISIIARATDEANLTLPTTQYSLIWFHWLLLKFRCKLCFKMVCLKTQVKRFAGQRKLWSLLSTCMWLWRVESDWQIRRLLLSHFT